jgi:hypothetical protein
MKEYGTINDKIYFAAAPIDEIGDRLAGKVSDYYQYLTSSALVDLWRRSYYSYYGLLEDTALSGFGIFAIGRIRASGQEGEVASIKVNHLRNLLTHINVLTSNEKQALKTRAINSDSESLSQAYLGDGLLDYYFREKGFEAHSKDALETCLIFGESYEKIEWDTGIGEDFGVDQNTGMALKAGDVAVKVYTPFDVVRDVTNTTNDLDWHICHDCKNRFDLAAQYPAVSEEILNISTDITSGKRYVDPTKIIPAAGVGTKHTDLIDVYHFFHRETPACPNGRQVIFLQDGTVLFDGPLAYAKYPITRLAGANIKGTPFGYSIAFDLLGIQSVIDKLYSVVISNQLASGMQNFWQPPGNGATRVQMAGGLNLIESVVKPEVLELLSTPPEIFNFIEKLEHIMEMLAGISAVNRGETPEQLKSGTALAYVASQAITFSSGLQRSYINLQQDIGTKLLYLLRDFVPDERKAVIAGSFNRPLEKKFKGSDLQKVDKVVVEATSALSQTQAGKIQIAQDLLGAGMIRNTREYMAVLTTGTIEPLYESEMSEILLVKSENEDLRDYKECIAMASDDHKLHWLEHRAILANPDARKDPQLVMMVTQHMLEHQNFAMQLQMMNPALLAWMGEAPLPTPMLPPAQAQSPASIVQQQNPVEKQAEGVNAPAAPNLPKNADQQTQASYEQQQAPQAM